MYCVATLMPLNVKLSPVAKLIVSPDELLIRDCISEALKPKVGHVDQVLTRREVSDRVVPAAVCKDEGVVAGQSAEHIVAGAAGDFI